MLTPASPSALNSLPDVPGLNGILRPTAATSAMSSCWLISSGWQAFCKIAHELIYALPKPGARSHERKGVEPKRDVLYRRVVAFKDLQRLTERVARMHVMLLERDYREVLPAGDACYETVVAVLSVNVPDYHRSGILRAVGVSDVEWYPLFAHRLHGLLMQHRRAHEGKLAKLGIGYLFNRLGVVDNARSAISMPETSVQFSYTSALTATAAREPVMSLPPRVMTFIFARAHTPKKPGMTILPYFSAASAIRA